MRTRRSTRYTGLVHDLDYERYPDLDTGHPRYAIKELEERGYPQEVIDAVAGHADFMGVPRETRMAKTLYAVDELSGFVAACALVRPTGIEGMKPKSVKKKLKQPSFAAAVNRDEVQRGDRGARRRSGRAHCADHRGARRACGRARPRPRGRRRYPGLDAPVPRWLKITLGVIAGLIVLLLLNALVVSNATKDAYVRDDGARLVDTSNGTLQVLDQGDPRGTPIVLIHCDTCSMNWWDDLAPLLERDHRVIRVDLLGHGGSDKPSAGYSIDDQASAVAEALAKLGSRRRHGGRPLARRQRRHGARASRARSSPPERDHRPVARGRLRARVASRSTSALADDRAGIRRLMQVAPKSVVRDQYDQAFAPGYDISSGFDNPDQPVDDLRAMTYTAFKDTMTRSRTTWTRRRSTSVSRPRTSRLVIFGAEDQIYDAQAAVARYRQNVPGIQTHLIPGAGHSPNVERRTWWRR